MKFDFQNKVVVVTGGANGIGRSIADEFQRSNAAVAVIDKSHHGDNGWILNHD